MIFSKFPHTSHNIPSPPLYPLPRPGPWNFKIGFLQKINTLKLYVFPLSTSFIKYSIETVETIYILFEHA